MKKALLIKGDPTMLDDPSKFHKDVLTDIGIMTKVASAQGYDPIHVSGLDRMLDELREMSGPEDFLFYFTGHANRDVMGRFEYPFHRIFSEISRNYPGRKLIVLDSCTHDLFKREDISFPPNSRIYSSDLVYAYNSLAKLFHDGVISWKKSLEEIDPAFFIDKHYNWVKVKEVA